MLESQDDLMMQKGHFEFFKTVATFYN